MQTLKSREEAAHTVPHFHGLVPRSCHFSGPGQQPTTHNLHWRKEQSCSLSTPAPGRWTSRDYWTQHGPESRLPAPWESRAGSTGMGPDVPRRSLLKS